MVAGRSGRYLRKLGFITSLSADLSERYTTERWCTLKDGKKSTGEGANQLSGHLAEGLMQSESHLKAQPSDKEKGRQESGQSKSGANLDRDDIIRMAREAGFPVSKWDDGVDEVMDGDNYHIQTDLIECFAALVAAAERNKVAQWMIARSYATGHGDTVEDLLEALVQSVREEERELCAQVCDEIANAPSNMVLGVALDCAAAIRARKEK